MESTKRSKKRPPYRVFRKFKCPECTKEWRSTWTWVRKSLRKNEYAVYGQKCSSCLDDFINPYEWEPLKWCSKCDVQGSKCQCKSKTKRHRKYICGRCHSNDPCPDVPADHNYDTHKPQTHPTNIESHIESTSGLNATDRERESAYTWARLSLRGNEIEYTFLHLKYTLPILQFDTCHHFMPES